MSSLLHQLENNEAVLLLYLSGELPPEDREEVDQQLASDPSLRSELDSMRGLNNALTLALSEADGFSVSPIAGTAHQAMAVRRVSRAMIKFQLERTQAEAAQESPAFVRRLRLPAWTYPFATAAMILIGWVAYWGFSSGNSSRQGAGNEFVGRGEPFRGYDEMVYSPMTSDESGQLQLFDSLPSMGMEEGDLNLMAISAGAYDVSSMFQPVNQ